MKGAMASGPGPPHRRLVRAIKTCVSRTFSNWRLCRFAVLRANEISKEIPERHRTIAMLAIGLALTAGAADAQTVLPLQNGRLGLAQTTRWVGDITGASTIYYTNDITVYSDPGSWVPNTQYDEFYSGSSICHQAWSARNGGALPAPTLPCSGIYIGSEETDANGQFNEQKSAGPSRRWDVWNAFYQKNIDLQVVDGTTNQQVTQESDWNPITPNSYATFIIGFAGKCELPRPATGLSLYSARWIRQFFMGSSRLRLGLGVCKLCALDLADDDKSAAGHLGSTRR